MEQKKKDKDWRNTRDEASERVRLGGGRQEARDDQGTQVHAGASGADRRQKGEPESRERREDLTPAGRGVKADRAARDAMDDVDRPRSREDEPDIGDTEREDSSSASRDRKSRPGRIRAADPDDE